MFRNFFNRKPTKEPAQKTMEPVADKLDLLFLEIKEIIMESLREKKGHFGGLSEAEIGKLEKENGWSFPKAYRKFLRAFADSQSSVFDGQLYNIKGIMDAQQVSQELLAQAHATLPDNHFAFSQWQGYNFYYFLTDGSDNPETFLYLEGGGEGSSISHKIYPQGPFMKWFIDLAINNIKIIGDLYGHGTAKEVERLQGLLQNSVEQSFSKL